MSHTEHNLKRICIALCTVDFDEAVFIARSSDVRSLVHMLKRFQSLRRSTIHANPIQSSTACLHNFKSRLGAHKNVRSFSFVAMVGFLCLLLMLSEDIC